MKMISTLKREDLEAAVDLVYEVSSKKGYNPDREANHQLMDKIKELDLGEDANRDCWIRIWEKYRTPLVKLGYTPGW